MRHRQKLTLPCQESPPFPAKSPSFGKRVSHLIFSHCQQRSRAVASACRWCPDVVCTYDPDEDELAEVQKAMMKAEGCEALDSEEEMLDDFLLSATQVG